MCVFVDPNFPVTRWSRSTVALDVALITLQAQKARAQRRNDRLAREISAVAELEGADPHTSADPDSEAAKAIYAKKIRKVMRRIERNFARCHPLPEHTTPEVTARIQQARDDRPVPAPEKDDDPSTAESVLSSESEDPPA